MGAELDAARDRLIEAERRLALLERTNAPRLSVFRAERSVYYWRRRVRLLTKEPYQRALALNR